MKNLFALMIVGLAGCAAFQNTERKAELDIHHDRTLIAYRDCMLGAADTYKDSKTTAFEAAVAAQAECEAEFHDYRMVIEATWEDTVPNAYPVKIRALTNETCAETEAKVKALVVQRVVKNRIPAKAPSGPRAPQE